jgi:hypothetical protein
MHDCLSGFLSLEIALRYNLRNIISKFSIKINEKKCCFSVPLHCRLGAVSEDPSTVD